MQFSQVELRPCNAKGPFISCENFFCEEIFIRISFVCFCSLCWCRTLTGPLLVCCSCPTTTIRSSSITTGSPALCAIRHPRTQPCALCVERSSVSRASAANSKVSASVCWWVLTSFSLAPSFSDQGCRLHFFSGTFRSILHSVYSVLTSGWPSLPPYLWLVSVWIKSEQKCV